VFGLAVCGELCAAVTSTLLVFGDAPFRDVVAALAKAQKRLGRDINPALYPQNELRTKLHAKHHCLMTVLNGPRMFIIGGDDELVGLGRNGSFTKHQTSRNEIRDLQQVVEADLANIAAQGLSADRWMNTAFNTALRAETAALAAAGYRALREFPSPSSHLVDQEDDRRRRFGCGDFDAFQKKQNDTEYERVGLVRGC
jgi:hypothetical protein